MESLLATQVGPDRTRAAMGPLFVVYDLWLADAHLASKEVDESLKELGVDTSAPYVFQGYQLMRTCVNGIYAVVKILAAWREDPKKPSAGT